MKTRFVTILKRIILLFKINVNSFLEQIIYI